jgi:hypothetical protein
MKKNKPEKLSEAEYVLFNLRARTYIKSVEPQMPLHRDNPKC